MSPSSSTCLLIKRGSHHPNITEDSLPCDRVKHLGSGAVSVVEEVKDRNTRRVYARKVFTPRKTEREYMRRTFENESAIIQTLQGHHHMIRIHATYTTTHALGMILYPAANGGDLDDYLDDFRHHRLPSMTIEAMRQNLTQAYGYLAAGLDFLKKSRIRHKDIKPQNILMHRGRIFYTDFGLASDSSRHENSSTDGYTEKTAKYAAPEVLAADRKNSSSDVYSLGCVFIKIYSALRSLFYQNEERMFSEDIANIHYRLRH
jgi:serine/threonine protein kinase